METFLTNRRIGLILCGAVLLLSFFVFFSSLGRDPLYDYDEATYANVIQDTEAHGSFMTLFLGDKPWFEKPPLYFWSAKAANSVFNQPEVAYRLPAAVAGFISILLVMLIAYSISGSLAVAGITGLILVAGAAFVEASKQVRLDAPVTATVLLAFYAYLRGLKDDRWLILVGPAIAIGILLKSVIALLAGPIILIWALVHYKWSWFKNWYLWYGALIAILIVVPWHLYETIKYGSEFWNSYLFYHVVERYEANIIGASTTIWQMISFMFMNNLPWTFVALAPIGYLVYRGRRSVTEEPALLSLTCMALFIGAVFLTAQTKIVYYLVPLYPFVALLIGIGVWKLITLLPKSKVLVIAGFAVLLCFGLYNTYTFNLRVGGVWGYNTLITNEEKSAGLIVAADPTGGDILSYKYPYWETLQYYSKHNVRDLKLGDVLPERFYLVVSTPLLKHLSFPSELQSRMTKVFDGTTLTLFKFDASKTEVN